jgi:hypothetical protein
MNLVRYLLILISGFLAAASFSQVDSLTYGISSDIPGRGLRLSAIAIPSGSVHAISPVQTLFKPSACGRAIDPVAHVFYYLADTVLLAFNLMTGEQNMELPLALPGRSVARGISFSFRDSMIYFLAVNPGAESVRLMRTDPVNGETILLSDSSLAGSFDPLCGSAIDPARGVLYFKTQHDTTDFIIGADLQTGQMICNIPLDLPAIQVFGPMEFHCGDSSLYGLAGNLSSGRKLAKLDPADGSFRILSRFNVADTLLNEFATIDPFTGIFYFEAIDHTLRGVDLASGDLVSMFPVLPVTGTYFTGFLFNHNCYSHGPSAIKDPSKGETFRIFPNPFRERFSAFSPFPLMSIEISDLRGRTVCTKLLSGEREFLGDLSYLPAGIYIARLRTEAKTACIKIIKLSDVEASH